MPDLLTPRPKFGACRDHLVIGLDDGQLGDSAIEPPVPKLTPPRPHGAEAQLHHGLEGEEDGGGPD